MERNLRKFTHHTFAVALCFMARLAMAQSDAEAQPDAQEAAANGATDGAQDGAEQATTEQPQLVDPSIFDKVLIALQNPSQEHMDIYIQLGLAVALVIGAIYMMIPAQKPSLMLTLDEDEGTGGAKKQVSKRAKAVYKGPEGAARKNQVGSETIDDILKKADQKRDGTTKELFDDLDQNGPWSTDEFGILDHERFIKLRKIIVTHQFKRYMARKEELLKQRIAAFQSGKEKEYTQLIQKAGMEYQQLGQMTTQEACEYIEMGEENYVSSFKNCEGRQEILAKLQEDEMMVRDTAEPDKTLKFSMDEIKKMHMEKVEMEFQMEDRMSKIMVPNKQIANSMMMIERTKIMDQLYVKYNVRLVDLMRGFKKYNLEEDKEIKTQQLSIASRIKDIRDDEKKKTALTDVQVNLIKEIVEGSGGKITEPVDEMGNIPYETYKKLLSAVIRITKRLTQEKSPQYKAQRRQHFEAKDEQKYAQCIQEFLRVQNTLKTNVLKEILEGFGVHINLYNKSSQFYKSDPAYSAQFMEDAAAYENAEQRAIEGTELSKEEALKYIKRIEEFKAETNAGLAMAMKLKQIPQNQLAQITVIAKTKAFDGLWQETGVEEEDLTRAFYTYRLSETDEFKQIIEDAKASMEQKIKAQAQKINEAMRAQGHPGMQGNPGLGPSPGPPPAAQQRQPGPQSQVTADTMDF